MSEPMLIIIIMGTLSVLLPAAFTCTSFNCYWNENQQPVCKNQLPIHIEDTVEYYTCPRGENITRGGIKYTNSTFSEVATLLSLTGERAIRHLFSRETHRELNFPALFTVLPIYFFLACWAAGTSIASGVVVPKMFIGGLIGRIIGRTMVEAFGVHTEEFWAWMDPGAFALLGAAAFFGGVSRLTMSLTVIMVELTNDVQFLLLIMVAIMVSKWVGDFVTHAFYHSLLEFKCIPFLDSEPVILYGGNKNLNLELFECHYVMSSPVTILTTQVSVAYLAQLMLESRHGGFPVVKSHAGAKNTFFGLITRTELNVLMCHEEAFENSYCPNVEFPEVLAIDYSEFCDDDVEKLGQSSSFKELLQNLSSEQYKNMYLNLAPYTNKSAVCIHQDFSLHRTYIIFRSLGLRHLTVVNDLREVVGIITRKDLMGFNLEEQLSVALRERLQRESLCQEMNSFPATQTSEIVH